MTLPTNWVCDPDCLACNSTPAELLGVSEEHWAAKVAEEHTCEACDFVYYRTVTACPKCNHKRLEDEGTR